MFAAVATGEFKQHHVGLGGVARPAAARYYRFPDVAKTSVWLNDCEKGASTARVPARSLEMEMGYWVPSKRYTGVR